MWNIVKVLPTDYKDYGGNIERWADDRMDYPDCSMGCAHYRRLSSQYEIGSGDADWGVCVNVDSPRAGLLTWEHQAGSGCFATNIE